MATKGKPYNKVILNVGYKQYVVEASAAFAFMAAITDCEEYSEEWNVETKSSIPKIAPVNDVSTFSVSMITPERYAIGKMTYKASQFNEEK